jgi:hypothetical protein
VALRDCPTTVRPRMLEGKYKLAGSGRTDVVGLAEVQLQRVDGEGGGTFAGLPICERACGLEQLGRACVCAWLGCMFVCYLHGSGFLQTPDLICR